ncbi:MAG: hypothetical protein A2660_01525 [Candidatus Doudnabacteria bacterium RIFCSPHIGHO2_01_FULL_45_18]|uniref:Uncharacterized protein n=1 Tax=Candidatus Doudnabacteria bacterium RIFCSPHIGHO2_01_FULL_45_18 TaxID=1817823 RepID=A0A1F5NPW7_9BACT|nr:MAG: hypothetical protein A2660_01525 [Candidatus Doudnabacteria bacterium RIFCSPHIGHO2_01_FULL_45_18]
MILQVILLFIGLVGLFKKKIKISATRELSGTPVVALSVFYLLMAVFSYFFGFDLVVIGIIGVVTLGIVIFAKGQLTSNNLPPQ